MAAVYRPRTLPMPDPAWQAGKDLSTRGFTAQLTREDLALDPQRVLLTGTPYDGIAAAIVDAEESADFYMRSERQDPAAAAAQREFRNWWEVTADYVHPPMDRDVSTGPGAWTVPEPDIVPRAAYEDLSRRDASGAYHVTAPAYAPPTHTRVPPTMRTAACSRCSGGGIVRTHDGGAMRCGCTYTPQPQPQPQPQRRAPAPSEVTRPEDDASSDFMVGTYLRATGPALTAATAASFNRGVARAARGGAARTSAMRVSAPAAGETSVYDVPYSTSAYGAAYPSDYVPTDRAVYGTTAPSPYPTYAPSPYDEPSAAAATLGAPNRYGLYRMPGTIDTTTPLLYRDAAVQGVARPLEPLPPADRVPITDALGFRYADRGQFGFAVPKFFPARDPIDKLLYQSAEEIAPDHMAALADAIAGRDMLMVEPLQARWHMMRDIAADMTHERDPYMVPRTGPSVLHPGRLATPPEWFTPPPGTGRRM